MNATSFSAFLITSALLTIAPGPDNIYLLTKSLADGARSGVALAAGLASGIVFHSALVMVGVAALVRDSPVAFAALRYTGAAYLLWLAVCAFRARGEIEIGSSAEKVSYAALYLRGVLMNVTNPKVLLFFLAFLPQFVDASSSSFGAEIAFYGAAFSAQAFVIFSALALFAGKVRRIVAKGKNTGRILGIAQGVVLTLIALALVFDGRIDFLCSLGYTAYREFL